MGIEQNGRQRRVVGDEAFDEDIEEKKVGLGGGEKEVARVVDGLEVGELVGELSKGGEVVVEAVEDDLGVGLREVGESGSLVQEVQEEVAAAWCTIGRRYVSANHYLSVGFGMCLIVFVYRVSQTDYGGKLLPVFSFSFSLLTGNFVNFKY
jgi:hypothetical protein